MSEELNGVSGRIAERAVGERSDLAAARPAREGVPDPELVERAKRRTFTAEYKLRVLGQAEACTRPGEIGAMLRREGLYTSHLTAWRRQRDQGAWEGAHCREFFDYYSHYHRHSGIGLMTPATVPHG